MKSRRFNQAGHILSIAFTRRVVWSVSYFMKRLLMRIVFGPKYQGPIDMVLFWRYAKASNGMINGFKPVRYFRFGSVVIKQLGWRLSIRDRNDVVRPYWADKDDRWSRISQEYK